MDDVTSFPSDPRICDCPCRAEMDALRAEIAEGVITRRVTVVDAEGRTRIDLDADPVLIDLLEADGTTRVRLVADGDQGHVQAFTRTTGEESTYADLFALDAEDHVDHPYVGVELIDEGTTAAGFALCQTHRPRLWTTED